MWLQQGLSVIPFRLPQVSCFTLSLKCFSSYTDNCPAVGIRPLLQFPHPPRVGPVLLILLLFILVPLSYRVFFISLYILFHWSGPPVCSQLVFCMHFCVWTCISDVFLESDALHVHLLCHLVLLRMLSFKPASSLSFFIFIKRLFSSSLLSVIRLISSAYLMSLIFLQAILIPAYDSSILAFHMMYSAYKLNKQGDSIQPWCTPFPILNQSAVPCKILTVASWSAYRCLKRQVRWSSISISSIIFHSLLWFTQRLSSSQWSKCLFVFFLEFPWFFFHPEDVGNLISGSFAFSKSSLHMWDFSAYLLTSEA